MNHPEDFREEEEARRKRLGLKPDEHDIDRSILAISVLSGAPLEPHEQLLIARLLAPELVAAITKKKKGKGRPTSNATVLRADRIAEQYIWLKAMHPRAKHKQDLIPRIAKHFRLSPSRIEKVLRKTNPARRAELQAAAVSGVRRLAEWQASPAGVAHAAEWDNALKRAQAAAQTGSLRHKQMLRTLGLKIR